MARRLVSPSVYAFRQLEAVALALKLVDRDTRRQINATVRGELNGIWQEVVGSHANSPMDRAVLAKGARIAAGNPAKAVAGTSRRPLSDGLVPVEWARAWEFGSPDPNSYMEYQRTDPRSLKRSAVRRRTQRQLPWRKATGRVVYPAFAEMGPRMTSLWVQIVVRIIHEKFESR